MRVLSEMRRRLSCSATSPAETRRLHALLLTSGLFSDHRLSTRLLSLYANDLRFSEAHKVLSSLASPDLFSFSTLIHAFARLSQFSKALFYFSAMLGFRVFPDRFLFPSLVKAGSGLRSSRLGKQLHCFSFTFGFSGDSFVQASLLHMYLKIGGIDYARKVFDEMPQPDLVCFSALVSGYANCGSPRQAEEIFSAMREKGFEPNTVSWNGLISGFNRGDLWDESLEAFRRMHSEGFSPDSCSVSSVLPSVADLKDVVFGAQIHCFAVKTGLGSDKFVASSMVDMYGKCSCPREMSLAWNDYDENEASSTSHVGVFNAYLAGLSRNGLVDEALELFWERRRRVGSEMNTVTWTSAVAICAQNGRDSDALEIFREMIEVGVKANSVTIPCVLPACGNIAALSHGRSVHCFSLRSGIFNDVFVATALIDMYSNCGKLNLARLCFDAATERNVPCWNAMMSAYAMHGDANETLALFDVMTRRKRSSLKPDFISFVCVLSACAQNGLVEKGMNFFQTMSRDFGVDPGLVHYGCAVTLLSRAGKLGEAYKLIREMPMEPDGSIWGSLLSSCRVHNNVELAEIAAERLFELEPRNPGNYVILSNIYASKGMWKEVDRVRDLMRDLGMRKNPGCSWIEVKNRVHVLLAGDKTHPEMGRMVEKLRGLTMEMTKSGYSPDFEFVLQDVEEHDKEHILCGHSEKLAVAFGLLNTPSGSELRVIKNLRICGDCHTFMKFVSSHEARRISVRDTNRFHHFKDGECSCGDFW